MSWALEKHYEGAGRSGPRLASPVATAVAARKVAPATETDAIERDAAMRP